MTLPDREKLKERERKEVFSSCTASEESPTSIHHGSKLMTFLSGSFIESSCKLRNVKFQLQNLVVKLNKRPYQQRITQRRSFDKSWVSSVDEHECHEQVGHECGHQSDSNDTSRLRFEGTQVEHDVLRSHP